MKLDSGLDPHTSKGWPGHEGYGRLYYDYLEFAPSSDPDYNPVATAMLHDPNTICKHKLFPALAVTGYAWLAPDPGYLAPYILIKDEFYSF